MSIKERRLDTAAEEELCERSSLLVDQALSAGAEEAEAIVSHFETIDVGFEGGDLKLTTIDEGTTIGLRVHREQRAGFASTNQLETASLARVVGDALSLAACSPPDPANRLPAAEPGPPHSLVHPSLAAMTVEEVVERARGLLAAATALDPRLAVDKASLSLSRGASAVASSAGAGALQSDAGLSLSLFGMAVDGDDVGGFDFWGDFVRDPEQWEAVQARTVERFAQAALGNLGAGAAESYQGPVLFSPAAFQSVFLAPLIGAASAIAVQRGRSALAGRLGQPIATPTLSIIDDPTDSRLAGATRYDREGVSATPLTFVEEGVLRSYLYNGYAAAVEGRSSTGHASGGARSVPGLGPHALVVEGGGGGDPSALRAALGRGLLVQRFSGSVDPASGDFSGVAKSARWVEGGEEVRSLKETLLSGNAFTLLEKILALSSEPEVVMGGSRVPWVLIDGINVVAG